MEHDDDCFNLEDYLHFVRLPENDYSLPGYMETSGLGSVFNGLCDFQVMMPIPLSLTRGIIHALIGIYIARYSKREHEGFADGEILDLDRIQYFVRFPPRKAERRNTSVRIMLCWVYPRRRNIMRIIFPNKNNEFIPIHSILDPLQYEGLVDRSIGQKS